MYLQHNCCRRHHSPIKRPTTSHDRAPLFSPQRGQTPEKNKITAHARHRTNKTQSSILPQGHTYARVSSRNALYDVGYAASPNAKKKNYTPVRTDAHTLELPKQCGLAAKKCVFLRAGERPQSGKKTANWPIVSGLFAASRRQQVHGALHNPNPPAVWVSTRTLVTNVNLSANPFYAKHPPASRQRLSRTLTSTSFPCSRRPPPPWNERHCFLASIPFQVGFFLSPSESNPTSRKIIKIKSRQTHAHTHTHFSHTHIRHAFHAACINMRHTRRFPKCWVLMLQEREGGGGGEGAEHKKTALSQHT